MAVPRGRLLSVSAFCALLALACLGAGAASAADTKPYIVVFKPSSAAGARAATSDIAADEHFKTSQRYDDAVHGFAARLDKHDLDAVRDDPRVAKVVVDRPVTATAMVPLASGDNVPTGVRRLGAGTSSTVHEASSANVAVIDTGVDLTHPDLNAVAGTNCIGSGAPNDDNGHGSHVAGTIGAKNDGSGAVGVAPGTKIFAVKVLNAGGSGYTSQIICGIDWVTSTRTDADATNDIRVANMSLGGGSSPNDNCGRTVNDPEHMAICNSIAAGVTYVVAAGNSSTDLQTFAPANYPEVLTVTSVTDSDGQPGGTGGADGCFGNGDDTPASYSNYATRAVDIAHTIAAPGTCIRSTYKNGMYATLSGTSMASPHVTGLVALCMGEAGAHGPCWGQTPAVVRGIMLGAATTAAAEAPTNVFSGAPSRAISGRYYGDMASTRYPTSGSAIPVNSAYPAISGTVRSGATLTASNGTWSGSPTSYTYSWLRCTTTSVASCSDVSGATSQTFALTGADVGRYLRVRVVAHNGQGANMMRSLATVAVAGPVAVAPAVTVYPTVSGTAVSGGSLTATSGTWTGTATITYAYAWLRCTTVAVASCSTISGATGATYGPGSSDIGRYLRVQVTATNARAAVSTRSSVTSAVTAAGGAVKPVNTVGPAITGTAHVASVLTSSTGTWTGTSPSYTYNWLRCTTLAVDSCVDISGATSSTYTLTSSDRGRYLRVRVTATNGAGAVWARSTVVGAVT
ncbi:MAG: putative serine protease [Conexibacter sp.]|nr:putative serine protease [Conexibacter sp.]